MILLDGKKVRDEKVALLSERILKSKRQPHLLIISIGNNENSKVYIKNKVEFGQKIGVKVTILNFKEDSKEEEVLEYIESQNQNKDVDGIIVQLPIPESFNQENILNKIDWRKDVDGLTAQNIRKLATGDSSGIIPATARGILSLLSYYKIEFSGKDVVVVGRSLLVGKTTALLFLNNNSTVTICHSKTRDLKEKTKIADILIVAVGEPKIINKDYINKGQVIIDVGITAHENGKIDGDVDFEDVKDIVSAISPVPNGVGPMTVLSLFENLLDSASRI